MAVTDTTFNEAQLISRLRSKGIRSADIADDDLANIIDDALDEYLFYRPKVCITTKTNCITTVADQPNYDKPSGALWVIDVCWHPDYASTDIEDAWEAIMLDQLRDTDPGIMLLDYRKMSLFHKYFNGHWEMRNDQIWLMPCPSDVYKVAVIYADDRTLSGLDEIADRRFVDLVYYLALMAIATPKVVDGGWRAGSYQIASQVGEQTMKTAREGLERTRLLLAASAKVLRS